jgi:hypothetical protein
MHERDACPLFSVCHCVRRQHRGPGVECPERRTDTGGCDRGVSLGLAVDPDCPILAQLGQKELGNCDTVSVHECLLARIRSRLSGDIARRPKPAAGTWAQRLLDFASDTHATHIRRSTGKPQYLFDMCYHSNDVRYRYLCLISCENHVQPHNGRAARS